MAVVVSSVPVAGARTRTLVQGHFQAAPKKPETSMPHSVNTHVNRFGNWSVCPASVALEQDMGIVDLTHFVLTCSNDAEQLDVLIWS